MMAGSSLKYWVALTAMLQLCCATLELPYDPSVVLGSGYRISYAGESWYLKK